MLTHPTLDQLNQLGLLGMAGAFGEMTDADAVGLTMPNGWRCCWSARSAIATTNV